MRAPLISVIMPVWNAEKFVAQAMKSILAQTLTEFEFIIIDDGSTDSTLDIIRQWNDSRIRVFTSEHKGVAFQSNCAVSHAYGKYISKMDADDISHADRLKEHYSFLERNHEIQLVGNNIRLINASNKKLGIMRFPESNADIIYFLPIRPTMFNGTITMHRAIFEKLGGYDNNLEVGEDHEFFLRYSNAGYFSYNIQKEFYCYRVYDRAEMPQKLELQNKISCALGKNLLEHQGGKVEVKTYDYYYRMGLIEYYRGSLTLSQHYFMSALKRRRRKFFHLFRFIIVSTFFAKLVKIFREKGIMKRINLYVNKYLFIDMQKLKR